MIETDVNGWDRLATGEIEISPVVGWAVAAAPQIVMLRLEIVQEGQVAWAQLGVSAEQAASLAQALLDRASRAMSDEEPGR